MSKCNTHAHTHSSMDSCIYAFFHSSWTICFNFFRIIIFPFYISAKQAGMFGSSSPLLAPPPCSGLINSTAGSECQPVDSCLHVQLWTERKTYILHIRGQINSEWSRAADRIDGAPGDGLWSRFINHNPATPVRTLTPPLMSSAESHATSVVKIPPSNCCYSEPNTDRPYRPYSLICSQYLDAGSLSVR